MFSVLDVALAAPWLIVTAGVPVHAAVAAQFWNWPPVITHSPTVIARVPEPLEVYRPVVALNVPAASVAGLNCGPPGAAAPFICAYPPGGRTTKFFRLTPYRPRLCGFTGYRPAIWIVSPT